MFQIVVMVFLLMNGQPLGDPMKLTNKIVYDNLETCMAGKTSEPIEAALDKLRATIAVNAPQGGTFTLAVSCEKAEDGSI